MKDVSGGFWSCLGTYLVRVWASLGLPLSFCGLIFRVSACYLFLTWPTCSMWLSGLAQPALQLLDVSTADAPQTFMPWGLTQLKPRGSHLWHRWDLPTVGRWLAFWLDSWG